MCQQFINTSYVKDFFKDWVTTHKDKDLTCKDKDKDQTHKDKDKDKD